MATLWKTRRASVISSICMLVLWLVALPQALALEAEGFGATREEARQRAAGELASQIQTRVQSVVESCTQVVGRKAEDCGARVLRRTVADLPLLGLRYRDIPGGGERFGALALLEPGASLPLYRRKLVELHAEFEAASEVLAAASDGRQRYDLLGRQLVTLRSIVDHGLVAVALGERVPDPPAKESALVAQRERLEQGVDSIALAVRLLLRDVEGSVANVMPLLSEGSSEVTEFSDVLGKALLSAGAGGSGDALDAKGEYRILEGGEIHVAVELQRLRDGQIVAVRTVRLLPAAFAGLEFRPKALDFEKMLRNGMVVAKDFKVEITTQRGGRDLVFRNGDTLRLLVRASQPVYLYVVGHVVQDRQRFSYLMPLHGSPATDDGPDTWAATLERFVRYLPPDQVNHHVEIGEFEVIPPNGTEHLQVFASTRRFSTGQLPRVRFDRRSGYFVIDGSVDNLAKTVQLTRGLAPKRTEGGRAEVAESVLTFTTMAR